MNWRIQVLGGLALLPQGRPAGTPAPVTRFESRKVAALLAYLALSAGRRYPREELAELLWPEVDPAVGRHRLRQALTALRRSLEPPGTPYGSVLVADRQTVSLNPDAVSCDAGDFDRLVRQGRGAEAATLYAGELLPGFYDDWIVRERERLATLRDRLGKLEPSPAPLPDAAPAPLPFGLGFLPSYLTAFFGRCEELRQCRAHLAAYPLTTITGLGGGGKTRLAVEAARQAADYDVVAFVSLADCVAPGAILDHVRAALRIPPSEAPAWEQIVHRLDGRRVLLVLDNFEQLVESGPAVVEALLGRLPGLTCLVTSRRLLGVAGERELPLPPLPLPEAGTESLAEEAQTPAVALFLDRARAARAGYQITERNRADLVALCRALDGVPLALELAASRIRALSPAEMRAQIGDRFRWLTRSGPGADKEPRHRSLAATLEWSWRLLPPAQQAFLAALSVFRGGGTAETADVVCDVGGARERLESLVMDSLVVSEEAPDGTTRFRLLETVRAFARERLSPADAAVLRRRHREAFLTLATAAGGDLRVLLPEAGNLSSAVETAIEDGDAETALALCAAADDGWLSLIGAGAALDLLRRTLALPGGSARRRVECADLASYFALLAGETDAAAEYAEEAMRAAGDGGAERARALVALARTRLVRQEPSEQALAGLRKALELARAAGEPRVTGAALRLLGVCANRRADFAAAECHLTEAVSLLDAAGDRAGATYARDNLANTAVQRGDLARALGQYEDCRRRAEAAGDLAYLAKVVQNVAAIYARQGRWAESLEAGRECIRRNDALGNGYLVALALWNLAEPLAHTGAGQTAARLMGFSQNVWVDRFGGSLVADDLDYLGEVRALVKAALGDTIMAELWEEGGRLTPREAVALALREDRE